MKQNQVRPRFGMGGAKLSANENEMGELSWTPIFGW